jgi:hypothetical protein
MIVKRLLQRFINSSRNKNGIVIRRFYSLTLNLIAGAGIQQNTLILRRGEYFYCTGLTYSTDNAAPITPPLLNFYLQAVDGIGAKRLTTLINGDFFSTANVSTPGPTVGGPGTIGYQIPVDYLFSPQQALLVQGIHQGGANYNLDITFIGYAVQINTLDEAL